jgi:hypothetical protein
MECPSCHLINPPGTLVCDCGYSFQTGATSRPENQTRESLEGSQRLDPPRQVDTWVASLAIANFLAAASFVWFLAVQSRTPEGWGAALLLFLAGACVAAGVGIWKRKSWARALEMGLLCLASVLFLAGGFLIMFGFRSSGGLLPLGLGVLSLASVWHLCQPETKHWFGQAAQDTTRKQLAFGLTGLVIAAILIFGVLLYLFAKALQGLR